jgi:hypothetical protein
VPGTGQRSHLVGLTRAAQRLDTPIHVPDVDVHPGRDAPVTQPERDDLATGALAAEAGLIPLCACAQENWLARRPVSPTVS